MVQSQVVSYQRLKKWNLISPCLTLSIIRYVSRVKWNNLGEGVASYPTPRCSSYWKGSLRVTLDFSCQLYLHIFKHIYLIQREKLNWNLITGCIFVTPRTPCSSLTDKMVNMFPCGNWVITSWWHYFYCSIIGSGKVAEENVEMLK